MNSNKEYINREEGIEEENRAKIRGKKEEKWRYEEQEANENDEEDYIENNKRWRNLGERNRKNETRKKTSRWLWIKTEEKIRKAKLKTTMVTLRLVMMVNDYLNKDYERKRTFEERQTAKETS